MRPPVLFSSAVAIALLASSVPMARQTAQAQQPPAQPPAQQAPAQQKPDPQQPQPPRIKSGINFVSVDVIVSDRNGQPIFDLTQADFKVKEDGKPQNIETFSIVRIDPVAQADAPPPMQIRSVDDEQREAQKPDTRLFIILLDDYHVRRGNDMAVRKPLIDFIENSLGPADMVAIMYPLTPITGLSFTRERKSLVSAVEHFEGRRFDYRPRNEFEDKYANYPVATVERIRNEVTMTAIKGASIKLGGMREGRKSLILVSEGFTNSLPPQLNDPVASMPGVGNPNRGNSSVVNSDRTEFFNMVDLVSDLSEIFREANRNNTSIYAVDPRGLAPFEYDINQGIGLQVDRKHLEASLDTLRALAENTDGRAIVNRSDLAKGMKQIMVDSSGYYLLGYSSSLAPTDGKFHKIDVEVTRKGVDVRARKGYWAYTAEDAARVNAPPKPETPPAIANALAMLAEPPRGRPARFWIGTSRAENGKAKVTFVWEPIAAAPGERRTTDMNPSSVMVTALATDGRPLFRGRVPEKPAAPSPTGGTSSMTPAFVPVSASFEAPPGRVQLRLMVQGPNDQVIDSSMQELTVPDYTTVSVSLGTPRVYRARTPREAQTIATTTTAVPTADRSFARTDRLVIKTDAYAPGTEPPAVTMRMLNRGGTLMSEIPMQTSAGGEAYAEVSLAPLAAGEYVLELNAKASAGSAQELIGIRIR
jgi:VWFA-related protein